MKWLILIPFITFGQRIDPAAKHFYASVGICEVTYHLLPKQKQHVRFLTACGVSLSFGVAKEIFDAKRCNREKRTGFDKMDLFTDAWGVLLWVPFRICINDYRKSKNKWTSFQD